MTQEIYDVSMSPARAPVRTRVAPEDGLASSRRHVDIDLGDKISAQWNEAISYSLVRWAENTSMLEDDDFEPPSVEILEIAIELARSMRDQGLPAPTRIVPDAEGGIVFERKKDDTFESIALSKDRTWEHDIFSECRLIGSRKGIL